MKRYKLSKRENRKTLIKNCDDLARQICHLRDKVCQRTGRSVNLQWCHFYTRGNKRVRWYEDNYCLLNGGVHNFWAHIEIQEFYEWWKERLGRKRFEILKIKANYCAPLYTSDLKIIQLALKERLKELQ